MIKSSLHRKGLLERGGSNRRHGEDDHEDDHGGDHEDGHGEVDHGGDGDVDDGHDDGCHDNIFLIKIQDRLNFCRRGKAANSK